MLGAVTGCGVVGAGKDRVGTGKRVLQSHGCGVPSPAFQKQITLACMDFIGCSLLF